MSHEPDKNRLTRARSTSLVDLAEILKQASQQPWPMEQELFEGPASLRLAYGQQPIKLGHVEFCILLYLASKPYHAFTRQSIADAVCTQVMQKETTEITADDVDEYVRSLRDQLGVLHDYVQTVPYIGYRFKP